MIATALIDVRCPECRRFLVAVPEGTVLRARCRDCRITFEMKARPLLRAQG